MVAFLAIYSICLVFINFANAQNSCKTPDNNDGSCVPLGQCPKLFNLVSASLSNEQQELLKKSHCGFDGSTPKVCCLSESIVSTSDRFSLPSNIAQLFEQGLHFFNTHRPGSLSNNGQSSFGSPSSFYNDGQSSFGGQRPSSLNDYGSTSLGGQSSFGTNRPSSSNDYGSNPFGSQRPTSLNDYGQSSFGGSRPTSSNGYDSSSIGGHRPSSVNDYGQSSFGSQRPTSTNDYGSNSFGSQRPSSLNDYGQSSFGGSRPSSSNNHGQSSFGSQRPTSSNDFGSNSFGSQRPSSSNEYGQVSFGGSRPSSSNNYGSGSSDRFRDLPTPGQCGTQVGERIFGGNETSITDFPWLALLHYSKRNSRSGGYFCGGSLINEYYVLTAAHCISGPTLVKSGYAVDQVRLGEHDLSTENDCEEGECADPVRDIRAAEVIVHESYNPDSQSQSNDIALIRLRERAPYTDYIRPICLPIAQNFRSRGYGEYPFVVAGFGKTQDASRSDIKLKVEVKGYDFERCKQQFVGIGLTNKQLCAGGERGKDSCNGDSGGPLIGQERPNPSSPPYSFLAGIVSFGLSQCGTPGYPGVYTRVDQYVDWIVDHMRR